MFQFPAEPDAQASTVSHSTSPRRDRIRHLIFGTLEAVTLTIKIQHKQGYAEPNDWSDPMPTGRPNEWFAIVTKQVLID
ncbi:MAG: hypothetical protein ACTS3T_05645 [Almyronema sp.]